MTQSSNTITKLFFLIMENKICNTLNIRRKLKSLIFLLLSFHNYNIYPQQSGNIEQLNTLLSKYDSLNQFKGNVIVGWSGQVIYRNSFGMADYNKNISSNSKTLYNIGSVGKMFTATAIMQLSEKGKLNLDDNVDQWLREYHLPNAENIKITHLLSPTSGFGNYMLNSKYNPEKDYSLSQLVKLISKMTLEFETPGQKTSYSNSAFIILGRIIEKASGLVWWEYYLQNIFQPAKMQDVYRLMPNQPYFNKAKGYNFNAAGKFIFNTNDPVPFTDGGLYATSEDLIKFLFAIHFPYSQNR